MDSAPSATTEGSCLITACKNPVEKSTHSDLQSKTEETEKTSVKKTKAAAGSTETFPEPRCQKLPQPDGVEIVSGKLERKVVRTKKRSKRRLAPLVMAT
jgi:E3 ubiquitin-protein ligase RBBP6